MKKLPIVILAVIICFAMVATGWAVGTTYNGYPVVTLMVNGKQLFPDVPAIIMDGRTLVPARAVAEALGYEAKFDATTNTVTIGSPAIDDIAIMDYDVQSNAINVPEKTVCPFLVMDGEQYLGISAFHSYVKWDGQKSTLSMPGQKAIVVNRDQRYEKGTDGFVYAGRTFFSLSAVNLRADISGNTLTVN